MFEPKVWVGPQPAIRGTMIQPVFEKVPAAPAPLKVSTPEDAAVMMPPVCAFLGVGMAVEEAFDEQKTTIPIRLAAAGRVVPVIVTVCPPELEHPLAPPLADSATRLARKVFEGCKVVRDGAGP